MGRIQGLIESGCLTEGQLIKSGVGYVFSITIGWAGCAVGNFVVLRDGITIAAQEEVVFPFPTANGTISREWRNGKKFDTGIFYDEGAAAGHVWVEITYK